MFLKTLFCYLYHYCKYFNCYFSQFSSIIQVDFYNIFYHSKSRWNLVIVSSSSCSLFWLLSGCYSCRLHVLLVLSDGPTISRQWAWWGRLLSLLHFPPVSVLHGVAKGKSSFLFVCFLVLIYSCVWQGLYSALNGIIIIIIKVSAPYTVRTHRRITKVFN